MNYSIGLKFHSVSLAQALKERRIDLKDAEQISKLLKQSQTIEEEQKMLKVNTYKEIHISDREVKDILAEYIAENYGFKKTGKAQVTFHICGGEVGFEETVIKIPVD